VTQTEQCKCKYLHVTMIRFWKPFHRKL